MRNAQKEREVKISGAGDGLLRFLDARMRKNASLKASKYTSEEPPSSSALHFFCLEPVKNGERWRERSFPSMVGWINEMGEKGGKGMETARTGESCFALSFFLVLWLLLLFKQKMSRRKRQVLIRLPKRRRWK